MHPDTRQVADNMKHFGFHILGRAVYDATFNEMMRPFAHVLSVVHAAHGAEMIVKARIAKEHPLLIFKKHPSSTKIGELLSVQALFDSGETVSYADLPNLLWATTGHEMKEAVRFRQFGKLRNGLVHFGVPEEFDAASKTLEFVFEVLDYLARDLFEESFVEYCGEWDDVIIEEGYLEEQLSRLKINVHPETRLLLKNCSAS